MEYGLIPNINQYADNNEILMQQIQPSNEIAKVSNNTKQLERQNFLSGVNETKADSLKSSETKEVTAQDVAQYQEVVLTNLNFGFNTNSQDFYVRAVRGESENQFPTDDMMRLKAYFIAQAQAESAAEIES